MERTTIRFSIRGMRGADAYKNLSTEWITIPTVSIGALKVGAAVNDDFEAEYNKTTQMSILQ